LVESRLRLDLHRAERRALTDHGAALRSIAPAEDVDKQVRIFIALEAGAKHHAHVEDVHHAEFARRDLTFGKPRAHLGKVIAHRQIAGSGEDDGFQCAALSDCVPSFYTLQLTGN
jgi:hypothetical protein